MADEYQSAYTGEQIDERLGKVTELETTVRQLTDDMTGLTDEVDTAAKNAAAAASNANNAANAATSAASRANSASSDATSTASNAISAANSAKSQAGAAASAASSANIAASTANTAAEAANRAASNANSAADEIRQAKENGDFDGSDANVTAENIQAALGYKPADEEKVNQLSTQKVSIAQGSANAGKMLVVGADGNLTLADIPENISGDVIGTIDENNNIVITGDLADGTYVFRYENADGTYAEIGSLVIGGVVQFAITANLTNCTGASSNVTAIEENGTATLTFTANDGYVLPENVAVSGATYTWDSATGRLVLSAPTTDVVITIVATVYTAYTNVLPLAQEYASNAPYVGSDGSVGYGNNMRGSTSSPTTTYMKALTGVDTTALIPVKRGDVLRFTNCNLKVTPANTSYGTSIQGYDSSKAVLSSFNAKYNTISVRLPIVTDGDEIVQITLEPLEAWTTSDIDQLAYIQISTDGLDETSIITINEEIV